MATRDGNLKINALFAVVVIVLAGVALVSLYQSMSRPGIQDAPASDAANTGLPQNHPPIDAAGRLTELEKMSEGDPGNADYKTQIGNAYYDLGQYQKAAEAYEASLRLRPGDAAVETDLASCYHFLGQEDKALNLLDKVLASRPDFPQALFNKGLVLVEGKHDTKGGVAIWQRLLQANPGFPQKAQLEQKIRELTTAGR